MFITPTEAVLTVTVLMASELAFPKKCWKTDILSSRCAEYHHGSHKTNYSEEEQKRYQSKISCSVTKNSKGPLCRC